jgi:HAD superfamily hydrolase (TIGR01509 family)
MVKYIFFDVSGTLLGKPILFEKINEVLIRFGCTVSIDELKYKHKLLSEIIHFPDRTDENFYSHFNSELLRLLGIVPSEELLKAIFSNCTYLPWEKFEDTEVLSEIDVPIGIISNFNSTLKDKLNQFFGPVFKDVLVSEELGVAKPKIAFYERALERLNFTPDEVLYIGDSIKLDIEPAMSLGIKSLLIDRDNFYNSSEYKINSLVEIKNYL